jgi:signal peptidase I
LDRAFAPGQEGDLKMDHTKQQSELESQKQVSADLPAVSRLETELRRERYRERYRRVLKSTLALLIVTAAIAILVVTLWMPVLQIYGTSMTPTLEDGNIVVLRKTTDFQPGDLIAFYYNNKILVKRVVAQSGDWFNMDEDGTVYINGEELEEPYVQEKAFGECDITLPYQVPEERVFVIGDHRSVSVDSRSSEIGCVSQDQVVGKLVLRVWPLSKIEIF